MSEDYARKGMTLRTGVHAPLEDAANDLLRTHLSGITRHSDKSDILTPWKEQDRKKREVYVPSGTPDAALRRGIFTRGINTAAPHLNSIESAKSGKNRGHGTNAWDSE